MFFGKAVDILVEHKTVLSIMAVGKAYIVQENDVSWTQTCHALLGQQKTDRMLSTEESALHANVKNRIAHICLLHCKILPIGYINRIIWRIGRICRSLSTNEICTRIDTNVGIASKTNHDP